MLVPITPEQEAQLSRIAAKQGVDPSFLVKQAGLQ
jgi:hypothetical protein